MDAHWLARDRDGDDDLRLPPALCVTHGNVCFAHHCAHDEGPTPTRPAPGCQQQGVGQPDDAGAEYQQYEYEGKIQGHCLS